MAYSEAKKKRRKLEREGKRNPDLGRGVFALLDLNTKKTETKKEKVNKAEKKLQKQVKRPKRLLDRNDGSDNRYFCA